MALETNRYLDNKKKKKIKCYIKVCIQAKQKHVKYLHWCTEKVRRDYSKVSKGLEERLLKGTREVEDEQIVREWEEGTFSWMCPAASCRLVRKDEI